MSVPALRFREVDVRLGGEDVLSRVSFDVAKGEIHCIVGPNGGGKTTLIRALLGQVPHEGAIEWADSGTVVGYAPQSLDLDRTMPLTVLDVMAIMNQRRPAFAGRSSRNRAAQDEAIARLGLAGKTRRLFGFLSGGERQRLLFAQALVPNPGILIMDEPTSNMDDDGARLVEGIVRELAAAGTTVLWVSHDWDQVRRVAATATFINRKVAWSGPPENALPAGPSPKRAA